MERAALIPKPPPLISANAQARTNGRDLIRATTKPVPTRPRPERSLDREGKPCHDPSEGNETGSLVTESPTLSAFGGTPLGCLRLSISHHAVMRLEPGLHAEHTRFRTRAQPERHPGQDVFASGIPPSEIAFQGKIYRKPCVRRLSLGSY